MWQIWVDTGGTFTDCIAVDESGATHRAKVLSTSSIRGRSRKTDHPNRLALRVGWSLPAGFFTGARIRPLGRSGLWNTITGYDADSLEIEVESLLPDVWNTDPAFEIESGVEAPILAAHWVTQTALGDPLPPISMRLATTRGTNALLERSGARTVLFVTRGFGDLLEIGNQQRGDLFALNIIKPEPLYESVIEVGERVDADGSVIETLDLDTLETDVSDALSSGIRSAAVALLHSYRNPEHEQALGAYLLESGFSHVSCSAKLAPRIKILPRAETAVVNAYLSEAIESYLTGVRSVLPKGSLHVLTSSGGLVQASGYQPKDSLLSGPAGGVVGAAGAALRSGYGRSIAIDMGGTSTDVSRYENEFDYVFETTVGDVQLLAPALAIETVAAGGGSICHFDGRQLKVGPQSAGAAPGPACYGSGGPLTLTDVNLLLGRLDPEGFEIPIDLAAAETAAGDLERQLENETEAAVDRERFLSGFLSIANETMAEAIRRISIRKGYDPAGFALVAFGGAGGQHACDLARILNISTVVIPADASLLSAVGLGQARVERISERQVLRDLEETEPRLVEWFQRLSDEATEALLCEGLENDEIEIRRRLLYLRLFGQETSLEIEFAAGESPTELFQRVYQDQYGYTPPSKPIEVDSLRVVASSRVSRVDSSTDRMSSFLVQPSGHRRTYVGEFWRDLSLFQRADLNSGARLEGPCLVLEQHSATLILESWCGSVDQNDALILEKNTTSKNQRHG